MPRLIFIAVILIGVAGCDYGHYVRRDISDITPIANSESFYAFARKDTNINGKYTEFHSFVRIEPDGTIRELKQLDTSFGTFGANLLDDSTVLYENYYNKSIILLHIYSSKEKVLLRGVGMGVVSKNKKFFVVHDDSDLYAYTSYELRNDSVREVGKMRINGQMGNSYGDSGFCYEQIDWSAKTRKWSIVYSGADLKPLRIVSSDSVEQSEYNAHPDLSELPAHALEEDFKGYYIASTFSLPDTNYILIEGKTKEEYKKEEDRRGEVSRKASKNGGCVIFREQDGYWMIADIRTKTLRKIADEYWHHHFSSTRKTILFVYKNNDTYSLKTVSLAEVLK